MKPCRAQLVDLIMIDEARESSSSRHLLAGISARILIFEEGFSCSDVS
jgi:hypothetical protein